MHLINTKYITLKMLEYRNRSLVNMCMTRGGSAEAHFRNQLDTL